MHIPPHTHHHTRRSARALLCAATVAALVLFGVGPATAAPTPTSCPSRTAIFVSGAQDTTTAANSSQPAAILSRIGQGLRTRYGSDIEIRTLTATTSYSPSTNSETSDTQALSSALASLCSSTRVVLAGYARGASIVGDLAAAIGTGHGPLPASRILAVTLISDPHRNSGTPQLGTAQPGQGIAGPRNRDFGALAGRVRTLCATTDLTCSTSPQAAPALTALGRAFTTTPATSNDSATPTQASTPPTDSATDQGPESATTAEDSTSELDPSQIIDQVVTVLAGLSGFAADVPAIVNDLAQLPGLIATGNIPELHRVSGDLNNQFAPLVTTVSEIDLHLVAQALTLAAPLDTSGWTAVAAQIVSILANLDIGHIAADIGRAQEIAWGAVQKLTTGDLAGAALALSGFIPLATDLATTAASALIGDAGTHLSRLANAFTSATTPDTSTALTDLARRGGDAARSTASGIQNGYTAATGQALHWLTNQIDHTT